MKDGADVTSHPAAAILRNRGNPFYFNELTGHLQREVCNLGMSRPEPPGWRGSESSMELPISYNVP